MVGILIGFFLPDIFVDKYTEGQDLTPEMRQHYKDQMFNMMLASAVFSTLVWIGVIVTFREHPGAPIFKKKIVKNESLIGS